MDFFEKVENLPIQIQDFFKSDQPRLELERSCFMYSVKKEDISKISGPVGLIFVGDVSLENLPEIIAEKIPLQKPAVFGLAFEINKRIFSIFPEHFNKSTGLLQKWNVLKSPPDISEKEAWKKVLEIEPWISKEQSENNSQEKSRLIQVEKLPLAEALKKYPELDEQPVTSEKIILKNIPEPVRATIKNWLSDYTFETGFDDHTPMTRGDYLFQNANTKNLPSEERERLSAILRSFDEKTPLSINTRSKEIIFPKITPKNIEEKLSNRDTPKESEKETPVQKDFLTPKINQPSEKDFFPKKEVSDINQPRKKSFFSLFGKKESSSKEIDDSKNPQKPGITKNLDLNAGKNIPQAKPFRIIPMSRKETTPQEKKGENENNSDSVVNLKKIN